MSLGYSTTLVRANGLAKQQLLGVRLGRVCIESGVSVARVAGHLGVSRQTVYNWFAGRRAPQKILTPAVQALLHTISNTLETAAKTASE